MTRHELWRAILGACVDIDRLVASSAGDLPTRPPVSSTPPRTDLPQRETTWRDLQPGPPRAGGPAPPPRPTSNDPPDERDRDRLAGLHQAIRTRLEALWRQLEREEGHERTRRALAIYLDERVMARLPEYLRLSWPLLQTELTRSTSGGADFFRFIDHALQDPGTPTFVIEVYYFCLNHGFVGMHANDIMRLDEYRQQLTARMTLPAVALPSPARAGADKLPVRWPVWSYYVLTFGSVAAVVMVLTILSNQGVGRGYG